MRLTLDKFENILLSEINLNLETDSQEYIDELDELIDSLADLRNSMGRGKHRDKNRKERRQLQSAIEAIRFLKRKSIREKDKNKIISEGGRKVPHRQGAILNPQVVTQAVILYKTLIDSFNDYLESNHMRPVKLIRPVGSTAYYQEDLEQGTDVVYGDIDYLVSLPAIAQEGDLGSSRKNQASVEREYTSEFLKFLQAFTPPYVNIELTGEVSPTMVVLEINDGKKIQVDLIATIDEYTDWMKTRWVPERGVKGYVGGNLYKSFGDTLTLTIGDQGVLARIKDGKRVSSKNRGADVKFVQISTNPQTFFKDIASYLGVTENNISTDLIDNPGMNPDEILITDIAKGIRRVAENLDRNNLLPDKFLSSVEMLEEVLARFKLAIDATVARKATPTSSGEKMSEESINKLVKMNSEQYNNVKREFNL